VHRREQLNLRPADRLIARQKGDRLVLERRDAVDHWQSAMFAQIPKEVSLIDELIAERRAETKREDIPSARSWTARRSPPTPTGRLGGWRSRG
jgi:hypothetical protein